MNKFITIFAILSGSSAAFNIPTEPTPEIPSQYIASEFAPNGQPESVRYKVAYENFWWACVESKVESIASECERICSGTEAATYGCRDGASDAEQMINKLVLDKGETSAKDALSTLICSASHIEQANKYGNNAEEKCANGI